MNSQRGFTLLELLIGMTLLGFILALLFGGFRLASTTWDVVETGLERTNQQEMTRALMRRLLGQMQPIRWKKAPDQPITFLGEPGRLVAVAPLSGQAGSSGLRVIEFSVAVAEQAGRPSAGEAPVRLVFREAPLKYSDENFAEVLAVAKEHTILDNLTSAQFHYFGPEKDGSPPQWSETWTSREQLPQLVRVQLGTQDLSWMDLSIAPMIQGGNNCVLDLAFKRQCR